MSCVCRMNARPIVGWPPVRSSRRNLMSSNFSSKVETESSENGGKKGENSEIIEESLFVKIKMDGVPIGRKVDLKSYTDYDNLSSAVDELFRGLLAGTFCILVQFSKIYNYLSHVEFFE